MKNKFIPIISPVSLGAALLFDGVTAGLCVFAAVREEKSVALFVICILSVILSVLTTVETLRHGIRFAKNEMELTALDKDNVYAYDAIEKVQSVKDTKASFKKNYVERYSNLVLYLKDGTVATLELGFTTKRKLQKIEEEIQKRMG